MADLTVNGDAVQTGENTFSIDGAQSGDVNIPENLSVADADFTFEGGDLVMSFPDGTTITVEGYQDNPNPPNLVSSDGAEVGSDVVSAMAGPADGGAPAGEGGFGFMPTEEAEAIQAQESSGNIADNPDVISGTDGEPIGNIESLEGEVFAIRADGERVRLELGDQVFQGDILESGDDGKVGVLLADETTFAMGSEGRMVLDEMVYDPATQEGSVSISVLEGVFTFVSGQVAKTDPDAMTLDTPVATIGIRGTQVGLDIRDGETLNVHLMEELGEFVGEVVVVNDGGVQVLNDANAFTQVSSFDSAPSAFTIVTVDDILTSYGEQTLPYLPTRNSQGERTSGNTYENVNDNVEGDDRESLDFLNDFQTDAGGNDEFDEDFVGVTGDVATLNIVEQARGDLTDVNKFVEEEEETTSEEQEEETVVEERDEIIEEVVDLGPQVPDAIKNTPGVSNPKISGDGKTITADITGDVDLSEFDFTFVLNGDDGANVIITGDGNDTLSGGGDDDYLSGGAGDDLFIAAPGPGDDTYDGGEGNDTITFAASDDNLVINLNTGTAYDDAGEDGVGVDTIIDIENALGGSGDDIIIGDDGANLLAGLGGDDQIFGLGGNDILLGGSGDDTLDGGEGDDLLNGGIGDDVIDGGEGMDALIYNGTYGENTISIVDGVMTVTGPDGTDTVENVENFVFNDSPNLVVGLEDTPFNIALVDVVSDANNAESIIVSGVPEGATLSIDGVPLEQTDGQWIISGDAGVLSITGAANSDEDFTVSFTSYDVDYVEAATAAAEGFLATQLDELTGEPLQTLEDFLADGGSVIELAMGAAQSFMPDAIATNSTDVEVIGIVDPFSFSVGGIDLTVNGNASPITFSGTEDQAVELNIASALTDTDGSEVLSVTISGLPTLEVQQISTVVPVLDENGEQVLDVDGNPVTEIETSFEPVTDASGNTIGAHLIYTDADGNDVILPANDTGTYDLTADQLNNLRLVGSPDDSDGFDLEISAQVQDGESTATVFGNATVELAADADVPTVSGGAEAGLEDQPVSINFDIDKNDISEHITEVTLTGIPEGSSLSIAYTDPDTGETFPLQIAIVNGEASIPLGLLGEDMSTDGLVLTPPAHLSGEFNLQLEVTSTEPTNGDQATNVFDMPLTLTAVADELGVTINDVTVVDGDTVNVNTGEDGTFGLDISALTADTDGSEVLSIEISGVPDGAVLSAGTNNGDGTWSLTSDEFADLSITPPVNSDVNFDLTVTVTNVDNNEDTISLEATVSVDVEAIADAATLTATNATGLEDTPIALDIASSLNDTDGSESLSITISNVPEGATLSAGTLNDDGSWTLTPEQLDGLTVTPGEHVSGEFNLTVTATTTEAANGDTESVSQQIGLSITPDPDAPTVIVTESSGNEDTAISLNIDAALVDQDGSETLSVSIAGVPEGATLSAGTNLGNGMWDVAPADLAGLTITPPADSNVDFSLNVTATATESNGEFVETTAEIPVTVLGVADDPSLTTDEVVGLEGTPIDLNISASLNDTDGSENLSITIENIPDGAFLLVGGDVVAIEGGVAHLTSDQLGDLSILPPMGSDEDFDLQVTATSTEDDNDVSANGQGVASVTGTLSVVVHEEADPPALMLFDASGNEDVPVPLNLAAILTDADETLSVTVEGIPEGTTLSAGTLNEDGSWTLEAGDLTGLTMTLGENSAADFSLQVTATSTTDDGTEATQTGSLNVSVAGVADDANLNLTDVSADEDTAIPLNIDASLVDTDGSETLSISVSNIPEGAVLTNALGDVLEIVDGAIELTSEQLDGLSMLAPDGMDTDFSLLVTATTTEDDNDVTANGQGVSSVSGVINVDMNSVADVPTLVLQDASGNEDGPIALDISSVITDASETLSITIAGVPEGAELSAGSNNNDGTWTLTPEQLDGLTITPPEDSNENFQLEVTATSTEQDGTSASTTGAISVGVTGVADAPDLTTGDIAGDEDTAIPLDISANLNDTDGSESLSVTIEGVPAGATLSAGSKNADGSWTLTGEQLDGLSLTPAADEAGSFSLMVTATSTENDGDSSSVTGLMNITVGAVADAPSLLLHNAAGFEDDAIPLEISTAAEGGDEIVGVTITGVPQGAELSAGTDNGDGTWSLATGDLDGLTITPPDNSNGNFQIGVTVTSMDGGDIAETTQSLSVSVTAVADKPTLDVPSQVTVEGDDSVDLDIESALTDLDGSESLSINISNIPEGAVLNIGDTVLSVTGGSIELDPSQLSGLQITAPPGFDGNFTLQVTATSTDTDPDNDIPTGLETNVSIGFIDVEVDGIDPADAPDLDLDDVIGLEDTAIALDIDAALTDPSETLSLTISGVPEGATLSAGTDLGNGTWSLLPEEADGLTITPPDDSNIDFALNVTATSTTDEGDVATTTGTVNVDVIGVADVPDLDGAVGGGTVIDLLTGEPPLVEGEGDLATEFPLDVTSSLNDLDGSETLSISITDLPEGVTLSAGVQNEDGSWTLSPDDLSDLSMTVPMDVDPDFDFDVTATATEDDGDTASVTTTLDVDGDDTADAPDLNVTAAEGDEDGAIALDISAALTDTDGSETLSITISGVPDGAELSAGTINEDGSWSLSADQLDGLTVTPPADSDVDFDLTVEATSRELSTGDTAVTTGTVPVTVNAVADAPSVAAEDGDGDVGQTVPLDIQSVLSDTDGSESLSITIAGFPDGASLNAGTDNGDGTYTLEAGDLNGLEISLPENASDDFDLTVTATSTEASNQDSASNVVTAAINVDPLASDDRNIVEIGEVTSGNILTGKGDTVDPDAAADTGSAEGNSVVDISFGGTTKSFDNPDDISSDADGNFIEIEGDHGTLKMYDDGSYDYSADEDGGSVSQAAGLTSSSSAGAVEEAWSGIQTMAFDFGTSFTDGNGKFDPTLADADVSFSSNGIGVEGSQNGMPAPDQINHDETTGDSEALALNLGAETSSVTLTVSNMFKTEDGGEEGNWQAYDADGNLVGEGALNDATVDYSGSSNVGTAEISLPDGASFQYIVFTATDTANDNNANDSSDFFVRAVEFETDAAEGGEDVFSYTMQDEDGDTATATLSINVEEETTASDPTLGVSDAAGLEDNAIDLDISAVLGDTDGSETLSITIGDVPEGAVLSAGTENPDGTWSVEPGDLAGLTVTPPADSNVDFNLTVTATSTEENGGATSSTTATVPVNVTGVADQPNLAVTIGEAQINEGVDVVETTINVDNVQSSDAGFTVTARSINGDGELTDPSTDNISFNGNPVGFGVTGGASGANSELGINGQGVSEEIIVSMDDPATSAEVSFAWMNSAEQGTYELFSDGVKVGEGVVTGQTDRVDPAITISADGGVEFDEIVFSAPDSGDDYLINSISFENSNPSEPTVEYPLDITSSLNDTDGSETLSISIDNVPEGAVLSAGTENPDGSWTLTPGQLAGLTITVAIDAEDFNLDITATSTENDGDTADVSVTVSVVMPDYDDGADGVNLTADDAAGLEDTAIELDIASSLNDTDGSEILSITIGDVPEGAVLSAGTENPDGTWSLESGDLDGLTITPPADSDADMALSISATSTEENGGETSTSTTTLNVSVTAVADAPTLSAEDTTGTEDAPIALDIASALTDTDGSESLSINVAGIPAGAELSAGTLNNDGTWTLSSNELDGLTVTPVPGSDEDMTLDITATTTEENGGDTAVTTATMNVAINAVADDVTLSATDAAGLEDNAIDLDISAALGDTDGSETLSITIGDVPEGAVLSAGTENPDGTWSVEPGDLAGLTVTPPADSNVDFNLTVTATSIEENGGAMSSTTATVPVNVTGVADQPNLAVTIGEPTETLASSNITITNMGQESAGYENSYGYYVKDADGNPTDGMVIWSNTKENVGDDFVVEGIDPSTVGFFVIPNGGTNNSDLGEETEISFRQDESGEWHVVGPDGNDLVGNGDPVLFSDPALNENNFDYTQDTNDVGNQNWEDLVGGGDGDFNDVNINVEPVEGEGQGTAEFPLDITSSLNDTDGSETLSISIDSVPEGAVLSAGTENSDGSWTLTPGQLAGLTITVAIGAEDFNLDITATSTENDGDTAEVSLTVGVDVPQGDIEASDPTLGVSDAAGLEDNAIDLDISAALGDTDGSESLSITIGGVPTGAVLSAGTNNNDGTWTLESGDLDGLNITPPSDSNEDMSLDISATSTESNGGDTSTTTATMNVAVTGVADQPSLSVTIGEAQINEGVEVVETTIDVDNVQSDDAGFTVTARSIDGDGELTDPSTDNISFNGNPVGFGVTGDASGANSELGINGEGVSEELTVSMDDPATSADVSFAWMHSGEQATYELFSNGVKVGEGVVTGQTDQIDPAVTLSADGGVEFDEIVFSAPDSGDDYLINSISFENSNPSDPTVEYPLNISSALSDTDGSETLSIDVDGLPEGASLSAGTQNQDGSWTLTAGQLVGLTVTVAASADDFNLEVTATTTENDGDTAEVSMTVGVEMPNYDDGADGVNLAVDDAAGLEDNAIDLDITSSLNDTDGSETLSITIGNVPTGAVLSAGTNNNDGTWTLESDDLDGLTVTPPTDSNEDMSLSVSATSLEENGGETVTTNATIDVAVTGVADQPSLTVELGTPTTTDIPGDTHEPTTVFSSDFGEDLGGEGWHFVGTADGWSTDSDAIEVRGSIEGDTGDGAFIELNDDAIDNYDDAVSIERSVPTEEGATYTMTFEYSPRPGYDSDVNEFQIMVNGEVIETLAPDGSSNSDNDWQSHTITFVGMGEPMNIEFASSGVAQDNGRGARLDNIELSETLASEDDIVNVEYPLDITSALTDTDGSETLSVTVDGMPDGASLSAGTENPDGSWTLSAGQLAGLVMTVVAGSNAFNLEVTALSTENDGDTSSATVTIGVDIPDGDGGVDGVNLSADNVVGDEDTAIELDIASSLNDTDGSEELSITISGVPGAAQLSAGTKNPDGTWTLESSDLSGLTITPPADSNEDMNLTVTATSTEENGGEAVSEVANFIVDVTGVADGATVDASVSLAEGHGAGAGSNSTQNSGSGSHTGSDSGSGHGSHSGSGEGSDLVAFFEVSEGDDNGEINNSESKKDGDLHGVTINNDSDGPSGSSAVFDGDNDYVEVEHHDDLEMDEGTVVLWFNTDDAESRQGLFSKDSSGYDDGGHVTSWVDDGTIKVRLQSGDQSFTVEGGDVTSGAWHQMALSFGPDGMKLYLNGEQVDSDSYTGGLDGNEEPLVFGANAWASGNETTNNLTDFFGGQMDQIGVYDRALTPTEMVNLYDEGAEQVSGADGALVYDLDIDGALVDTDGSESLSFEVRGLPDGVELSAGTNDGNGNWALTTDELAGLTMTVDPSVSDDFSIEVVAIGEENDGDVAESPIVTLDIDVTIEEPVEINGTWRDETLEGGGGDDTISGDSGKDKLYGAEGDDVLNGGSGNDSLFGDAGDDVMDGGYNDDYMSGGDGADEMVGGSGKDEMFGDAGNDIMDGGHDNDELSGGAGNDTIDGGTGNDTIEGGEGDDVLTGGWGNDEFMMDEQSGHDIIQDIMEQDTIVFEGQAFHADDMIFNENEEGDVVVSFAGVEGQSVTLNGVSMDDLGNDGDASDGYSITEDEGKVTLTIDSQ